MNEQNSLLVMLRFTIYLLGSSIALALGGVLLFGKVPLLLTAGTLVVVVVLFLLAIAIEKSKDKRLIKAGVILALLSIITSSISSAHQEALAQFGKNAYLTELDVLMILGFYVFPLAYIVDWAFLPRRSKV
uniref:Uncharacterized protein n=3 Tax=Candidatus Aramenus sulfurataquae TaxID=1326980 RepID=A0AAE3FKM4_9CREN|nr:hypothetical protein [Candidatus Aramenus sulfurataquae]